MPTYEEYILQLVNTPLLRARGAAYLSGYGAVVDDEGVDRVQQSVEAHIVEKAPDDALPTLGRERVLERYPAETDDGYRSRLAQAFNVWRQAGTKTGVLVALTGGFPGPIWGLVEARDDMGIDPTDWAGFFVTCDAHGIFFSWQIGGGRTIGEPGLTIGSTATTDQIRLVKGLIKKWKAGWTLCEWIDVTLDDDSHILWPFQVP